MSTPMRAAVLGSTSLAFVFAIIAGAVLDNALHKMNKLKDLVRAHTPPGAIVHINIEDVFSTTIVLIVSCSLLSSFASTPLLLYLPGIPSLLKSFLTRSFLRIQAFALAFWTLWTLATLIPFDVFFAMRQAKITATMGGMPVPQSTIDALVAQLGVDPVYRNLSYLRLVAILPWFAVFFGFISVGVLLAAANRIETTSSPNAMVVEKAPVQNDDTVPEVVDEMNLKNSQRQGEGPMKEQGSVSVEEAV